MKRGAPVPIAEDSTSIAVEESRDIEVEVSPSFDEVKDLWLEVGRDLFETNPETFERLFRMATQAHRMLQRANARLTKEGS